jgi:hypothetical protein
VEFIRHVDGEAVASGGDEADTELLLLLEEDDEEVGWAGPTWAPAEKGEGEEELGCRPNSV